MSLHPDTKVAIFSINSKSTYKKTTHKKKTNWFSLISLSFSKCKQKLVQIRSNKIKSNKINNRSNKNR